MTIHPADEIFVVEYHGLNGTKIPDAGIRETDTRDARYGIAGRELKIWKIDRDRAGPHDGFIGFGRRIRTLGPVQDFFKTSVLSELPGFHEK